MKLEDKISRKRIAEDRVYRIYISAFLSFLFNLSYALLNLFLGIADLSVWFIAMSVYYAMLSAMRILAILYPLKRAYAVRSITGMLLIILSIVLSFVIYISERGQIASAYGDIIMITIATYVFLKIGFAINRRIKHRRNNAPELISIRCISYADVSASLLTLQRSMLASFEGMTAASISIMNRLLGAAVCLFILFLGLYLLIGKANHAKDRESADKGSC